MSHNEHRQHEPKPRLSSLWKNENLPFRIETVLLVVLAVADVLLTNRLLAGRHQEANPIANWVYRNFWGMRGLAVYKFILIAIICTLAQVIAIYRKPAGLAVMWIAVIAHALVVIYSVFQLAAG